MHKAAEIVGAATGSTTSHNVERRGLIEQTRSELSVQKVAVISALVCVWSARPPISTRNVLSWEVEAHPELFLDNVLRSCV